MYPIILQIGSFAIRSYGLMAALGFLAASYLLDRNRNYADLTKDQSGTLLILALISGLLGARIFYVCKRLRLP